MWCGATLTSPAIQTASSDLTILTNRPIGLQRMRVLGVHSQMLTRVLLRKGQPPKRRFSLMLSSVWNCHQELEFSTANLR